MKSYTQQLLEQPPVAAYYFSNTGWEALVNRRARELNSRAWARNLGSSLAMAGLAALMQDKSPGLYIKLKVGGFTL